MSALSSLTTWLNRFFDKLTASQSVLANKGSHWFEKARRSKFGTTCEFKKMRLPLGLLALEDRITPHGPGFAEYDVVFGMPEPPELAVPIPNYSTKTVGPNFLQDGPHEANIVTIVLDFKEPAQGNTTDIFGHVIGGFDVTAYGFISTDFNTVAKAIAAEVDQDYFSELVGTVAGPAGQDLRIDFVIGDIGTPPVGASEYYYVQIGSYVSGGSSGTSLGVAGTSVVRNSAGTGPNFGVVTGNVVGSVFTNNINKMGSLTPSNALTSGNLEYTTMAVSGTLAHEIGHTLSLSHIDKAMSVQAVPGTSPLMGTGAIDLPNQDRLTDRSFSLSGFDKQNGGAPRMHVQQLTDAVKLHGTTPANTILLNAFGTSYIQTFDTLANSGGESNLFPSGWFLSETGSSTTTNDGNYVPDNGNTATGDAYSYGTTGSTERAFGGLQSSSLVPTVGASFTNNTGGYINSLLISYFGEQWRLGATGRTDRLDFQFSLNATSLTTGSWTNVDALDFTAPISGGTTGKLDGNLATNRISIASAISNIAVQNGATIWVRWNSFDASGADDGLAIDDFTITPNTSATIGLDGSNNLTITPAAGATNKFGIKVNGNNYLITGADSTNGFFSTIPTASGSDTSMLVWVNSVTGSQIIFNGGDGNDQLTVDFSGGQFADAISFDGGDGADSMAIIGTGSDYARHIYNYTNATDGDIQFDTDGSGPVDYTVTYTNLAPLSNDGTPDDIVFNMPASTVAVLDDDGTASNGISRLSSANFETTDFANPTNSVTINGFGGTLSINSPVDFTRHLTIGSSGSRLSVVNFNGTLSLGADRNLSAFASNSISFSGSGVVQTQGTGTIGLDSSRPITLASGASLKSVNGAMTLSANAAGGGTGAFHGLDMDGATIEVTGSGALSVTARGGDTGAGNQGVRVFNGSVIRGGTTGTTAIVGIGGGSSGSDNHGVFVTTNNSQIATNGSLLEVTGTEGFGSTGIQTITSGLITTATSGGDITLISNNVVLSNTPTSISTQAAGMVTVRPRTAGVGINLGAASDTIGGPIGMTTAEFGRFTTGTLRFGDNTAGSVTVTAALTSNLNYHLELISGASITFNNAVTMAVNKNLTGTATSTIQLLTASADLKTSGTGSIGLTSTRNINLTSGSSVVTADGDILLSGNFGGGATGTFNGVLVTQGTVSSTGGNVTLQGRGGDSLSQNHGVSLVQATISGGSVGKLTKLDGTGGPSTGSNYGVNIASSSTITSAGSHIEVMGQGGGTGTGGTSYNRGVNVAGVISASSSATNISVTGTAGNSGNGTGNTGVNISFGQITATGGNVTLIGTAGASTGQFNRGVNIETATGLISTTGSGSIGVTGHGAAGTGTSNPGINFNTANSKVQSASGPIVVTGTSSSTNTPIEMSTGGHVVTTAGGAITLIGDRMAIGGAATIDAGSSTATMRQNTNTTQINLGGADGSGTLGLTDTELDRITAGTLILGSAASGDMSVTAGINRTALTNVELRSGGDIVLNQNFNTGGGTMLLSPGSGFALKPKAGIGIDEVTASTTSFNTNFSVLLNGTTENVDYDSLWITGIVNLSTLFLILVPGTFTPVFGNTFRIIRSNQPIQGKLTNLPNNGDTISFQGKTLQVNYNTNDVTLSVVADGTMTAVLDGGGNLVVTDTDGTKNNSWTTKFDGTNIIVADANESFATVPAGAVLAMDKKSFTIPITNPGFTGDVVFLGAGGSDTLTVDNSLGTFTRDIDFQGGTGTSDQLTFTGGSFTTVTHNFTNANDGDIVTATSKLSYTGLEPVDMTGSTIADLVFNLPTVTASNVILEDDGTSGNGKSRIRSSPVNFETTDFSNPTNSLTINRGKSSDSMTVMALPDFDRSLNIGASTAPFGPVTVTAATTLANGYSFSVYATGTIQFGSSGDWATTGSGSIGLTTTRNISLVSGSISSVDGEISLSANVAGSTAGDFHGIEAVNSVIEVTGSGNLTLHGKAGAGAISSHNGVRISSGTQVLGGTAGTVSVTGRGGASSSNNYGVAVLGSGSVISSLGANVSVVGTATGGGSTTGNFGVFVASFGEISATGLGTVQVHGTGGASGTANHGVVLDAAGTIGADANVTITGVEGGGTFQFGIFLDSSSLVTSSAGSVEMIADTQAYTSSMIQAPMATVFLRQRTNGRLIIVGGSDTVGTQLGLSDAELDQVTAATLKIGDDNSGGLTVSATINRPAATNVALITGGDLKISGGQVDTNGGTLLLNPGNAPNAVYPTNSGVDATASTTSFLSDLAIAINGTTVDTQYAQLNVVGSVDLTGVDLVLSGSHTPTFGNSFVIVNTTTGVVGEFNGLTDGDTLTFNGQNLQIDYTANTVVLNFFASGSLSAQIIGNDLVITDTTGVVNNFTATFDGTNFVLTDAAEQFQSAPMGGMLSNGNKTLTIPATAFTGKIIITTQGGSDTFTLDNSVQVFTRDVDFNGGTGTSDQLKFTGGSFTTVTHTFANANDGDIQTLGSKLSYTGLEPVDMTGGTIADLVFNLPAAASAAFLEDDGTSGNTFSRLRSNNGTFETTTFSNPTNSLTINRGNGADSMTIASMPDFDRSLTIGIPANPFDEVNLTGTVTLASGTSFTSNSNKFIGAATGQLSVPGKITLRCDQILMDPGVTLPELFSTVTIEPVTPGTQIHLGGADGPGILGLTDAELDTITAGLINVGNSSAGAISFTNSINPDFAANLSINGGNNINWTFGTTMVTGQLTLVSTGGNIGSMANPLAIAAATLQANANSGAGGQIYIINTGTVSVMSSSAAKEFNLEATGSINVIDYIDASAGTGDGGNITLKGGAGITGGTLLTQGGSGGRGGNISITATAGNINIAGNLSSFGGSGAGGRGGDVTLSANAGTITIGIGGIDTHGNINGVGGSVSITAGGFINVGGLINSQGSTGANGKSGGFVLVQSFGDTIGINSINSSGGGSVGSGAGAGGSVTLQALSGITSGAITATGGSSQAGGNGGHVSITTTGGAVLVTGDISALGGNASGPGFPGGKGGNLTVTGGSITLQSAILQGGNGIGANCFGGGGGLFSINGNAGSVTITGMVNAKGGSAGPGLSNGGLGFGGSIFAQGDLSINTVDARGGQGGNNGAGTGGSGGAGGSVTITSNTGFINSTNSVLTTGGGGGSGTTNGGAGGSGGSIKLQAGTTINVNQLSALGGVGGGGVSGVAGGGGAGGAITILGVGSLGVGGGGMFTGGGSGGTSGSGVGGSGGHGGAIFLQVSDVTLSGPLTASGGNSGTGVTKSAGGNGGTITIATSMGGMTLGSVTTIAGTGSPNGAGGNVHLSSAGLATQTGPITATGLRLIGTGDFDLLDATNFIQTLVADTGNARIQVRANGGFNIGAISGTEGIKAKQLSLNVTNSVTQSKPIETEEIQLLSFGFGDFLFGGQNNKFGKVTGNTAGKVELNDIGPFLKVEKASPVLFMTPTSGLTAGGDVSIKTTGPVVNDAFLKVLLNDVFIEGFSYSSSGSSEAAPIESFSLNFTKIDFNVGDDSVAAKTKVTEIQGSAGTNVNIQNTGPVNLKGFASAGGKVFVSTMSPMTVSADVIAAGAIVLSAGEDAGMIAGDDLTVNAGVKVQSTGSTVTLEAGDNVVLAISSDVISAGAMVIEAGVGNNDGFAEIVSSGMVKCGSHLTMIADDVNLGALTVIVVDDLAALARIRPQTAGRQLSIGSENAGLLSVTNAELNTISAGTIILGSDGTAAYPGNAAGKLFVLATMSHVGDADIVLVTARDMAIGGGWTTADGDLTFRANQQPTASTGFGRGIAMANVTVQSTGAGNITMLGRGGDTGANLSGINIESNSDIVATGTGQITLTGTGGAGGAGSDAAIGVFISGAGTLISQATGELHITGVGGSSPTSLSVGILMFVNAVVSGTGLTNVTLHGTGGTSPDLNHGVWISELAEVNSVDGDIDITGIAGSGGAANDIDTSKIATNGGEVAASGIGNLRLVGNSMAIGGALATNGQTIAFETRTATTTISIGGADAPGVLGLTQAEFLHMDAKNKKITLETKNGDIDIFAIVVLGSKMDAEFHAGGDVSFNSSFSTAGGSLLLNPGASPKAVRPMVDGTEASASTVTFGSDLLLTVTSAAVHDQLTVSGAVDLSGVDLQLAGMPSLTGFETFVLVSASSVIDEFDNFADGAPVILGGKSFVIDYTATEVKLVPTGTMTAALVGNDLVITDAEGTRDNNWTITYDGNTFTISDTTEKFSSVPGGAVLSMDKKTVSVHKSMFTGQVIFVGNDGSDDLTVDWSLGNFDRDMDFDGGAGMSDALLVTGGTFSSAMMTFDNANDGDLAMDPTGSDPARFIMYTGLEPVNMTGSTIADLVFNLPGVASDAFLEDDGISGNAISRIRSNNGTFETTTFGNPTNSLTISRGNSGDVISITDLPDFDAHLTIGTSAAPFLTGTLDGEVTLASSRSLYVVVSSFEATADCDFSVSAAGTITIEADNAAIGAAAALAATGVVTVRPRTVGTTINIGGADGVGTLGLTDAELDAIDAGTIVIGADGSSAYPGAAAGNISINAPIQHAGDAHFDVVSLKQILNNSSWITATGNLTFRANEAGLGTGSFGGFVMNNDALIRTTGTGNIYAVGRGGNAIVAFQDGVQFQTGSRIETTGTGLAANQGTITLIGIGGSGGSDNDGVEILGNAATGVFSTGEGSISMSGTPGVGANSFGIDIPSGTIQSSAGTVTATITLLADSSNLPAAAVVDGGTHTVSVLPLTAGTMINLGGSDAVGVLGLTDAELDTITAGTLIIGDGNTGDLTVSSIINRSAPTIMIIVTDGNQNFVGGGIDTGGGQLKLDPATGSVNPLYTGTDVAANPLYFGSDVLININGKMPNVDHDQLKVSGAVDLANAVLKLGGGYTFLGSDTLTIVSADTVTNTFFGLADGATFGFGMQTVQINYTPTTVTLKLFVGVSSTLSAAIVGNDLVITDVDGSKHNNLSVQFNGTELVISDANEAFIAAPMGGVLTNSNKTLTVPAAAFTGRVIVNGVGGNDVLHVDESAGSFPRAIDFHGGTGIDELQFAGATTALAVTLIGISNAEGARGTISGIAGSFTGVNSIVGGMGTDQLFGRSVNSTWAIDSLLSYQDDGLSSLTLAGFEQLRGGAATDTFAFFNNTVFAGLLDGGVGYDALNFNHASNTAGVSVQVSGGNAGQASSVGNNFANVENVTGSGADDTFAFAVHGARVSGRLDGGGGIDTLDFAAYNSQVRVNLNVGVATAVGTGMVPDSFENVIGGSGNDVMVGNEFPNEITGGGGHDIVLGGDGDDTIAGNSGNDILIGGDGADSLQGDAGDDIFIGGTTSYDNLALANTSYTPLLALMMEWSRVTVAVETRWARINGTATGGLNGAFKLNGSTVADDGYTDTVSDLLSNDRTVVS